MSATEMLAVTAPIAPPPARRAAELLHDAVAAIKAGDKERGRTQLVEALDLDPRCENGWLWLAHAAGSAAEKKRSLARALELNPSNASTEAALFRCRLSDAIEAAQSGRAEEAHESLLSLSISKPGNELVWLWLASVTKDTLEAETALGKVLEISPGHEQAKKWLDGLVSARRRTATPVWRCPICREGAQVAAAERCPSCRAIVTLTDAASIGEATLASIEVLDSSLAYYAAIHGGQADFRVQVAIALAHLNARRTEPAIAALEIAHKLRDADESVKAALVALRPKPQPAPTPRLAPLATASAAAPASAAPAVAKRRILVVDDSPTVRRLVTVALQRHGIEVAAAADGMQALAQLREKTPDLVLLDITMPQLDGYQICKLIKGNAALKHVPVVMLTGKDGFVDKVKGKIAGASEYLTKPFVPETLLEAVERLLSKEAA